MNQNTDRNRARQAPTALSSLPKFCLTMTALAWGLTASAQTFTTTTNFMVKAMVPDADACGLASVQTISTPITHLTSLKVALKISGTWNGDLYCVLAHGTNYSVLLNRPGRTDASNLGYNDMGLDLIFDDAATNSDIHVYRLQLTGSQGTPLPGPLTDSWAPTPALPARPMCWTRTRALRSSARSMAWTRTVSGSSLWRIWKPETFTFWTTGAWKSPATPH